MKRKFLVVFMAIVTAFCMAFSLVGCGEKNPDETGNNPPITDPSGGEQGGTQKPDEGEQGGTQKPDDGEQGGTQKPDDGEQGGTQKPDDGGQGETPAPHVHSFGEWEVTKGSTCKEAGTKERSCICGERETETLPLVEHDFENMTCRWCGLNASVGLEYTLINGDKEYEVSGIGDCKDENLIITNNYQGKPVTSIGRKAFYGCDWFTSVNIPNSVTLIEDYSFFFCSGLTGELKIPDNMTLIGSSAFAECIGLTSVNISDSVTSIGKSAFYGCIGLTSVNIPDSVTSIGEMAFYNCIGLTSVNIPDTVTSIGEMAFYGCYKLVEVWNYSDLQIEEGSEENGCVGAYALKIYTTNEESKQTETSDGYLFYENDAESYLLGYVGTSTVLTLPEKSPKGSIYKIYQYAFYDCYELTSSSIPNSVTSIGESAFWGCIALTAITIPDSVTSISDMTFAWCSGLTTVIIGSGVTSIGEMAFRGCSGLTSITIPARVTSIGYEAFDNCSGLKEVHISDLAAWCEIEFDDYNSNPLSYAQHLFMDGKEITELQIPSSVTSIGGFAFDGCSNLISITIPDSVTSIGDYAFSGCSALNSVTIPDGVTEIGEGAFSGCSGLTSVTIPNSVTSIGSRAFRGCSGLKEVSFKNPNGWKLSQNEDMSGATTISGLEDPARAAKYLTDSYYYYYWKREG